MPWFSRHEMIPRVPWIATSATRVGRSERHRPRHPCTPGPLWTVRALPRCQTRPFDFCNTSNDTRARLRSNVLILARRVVTHPAFAHGPPRRAALARQTVCSELHGLISMPRIASKQPLQKKRPRSPSPGRARAAQADEARVKVKSARFPGCPEHANVRGWASRPAGYRGELSLTPSLLDAAPSPSCHRRRERRRMVPAPSLTLGQGQPSLSTPRRVVRSS